ncbi:MAG: hypothetical protein C0469_12385 [Cyanobacteria bacterium DS2.3.42]|nr:hypothetical protein [Cyanobacteria bacterium DS2.3.42]
MVDGIDSYRTDAYRDAVSDINSAVQNPGLWDEVNEGLKKGLASGKISYEGLETVLPEVGLSGSLITSEFDRLNSNHWNDSILGIGKLSEDEIAGAINSDSPLTALAANLIKDDITTIRGKDWFWDPAFGIGEDTVDWSEVSKYKTDGLMSSSESVREFIEDRDGTVGDGDDDDDDSDDDESGDDSDDETKVDDDNFKDLDKDDLIKILGDNDKSPADRLRAAWELHEDGFNSIQVEDGDTTLSIDISTDNNGMISLWSPTFNGPIMKGVVRDGHVLKQDDSYFGTRWRKEHDDTVFK